MNYTMKLHILSDLHNEFSTFNPPSTKADVVILAGDIHNHENGVTWAAATFQKPVLYVAGNRVAGFVSFRRVAHRAQLESVVRIMWLTHAASDAEVSRFLVPIDVDTERTAKNFAQAKGILVTIENRVPTQGHSVLVHLRTTPGCG
jgi:hypothetical protein